MTIIVNYKKQKKDILMGYTLSEEIWQIFYKILTYQTEIRIKNADIFLDEEKDKLDLLSTLLELELINNA